MVQHVIVVGAGLIGSTLAAQLLTRGTSVTLLERAVPGAEASSAAGGILSPQAECDSDGPLFRLCAQGVAATRALGEAILGQTGIDIEFDDNGTDLVAHSDEAKARLHQRLLWQRAAGFPATVSERGDTLVAHFPTEARLLPSRLTAGATALARLRGARVISDIEVQSILRGPTGQACGVRLADGVELTADAVCVCAGAWSALVPGARIAASDVFPVRGQMLEFAAPKGTVERVTFFDHAYVIPRRNGHVVAGSTMEKVGFDKRTTEAGLAHVKDVATRLVPALATAPVVAAWAGLRPATSDGLPIIGETSTPGLFVSSGHFRNGILLAAISAERLADVMLGAPDTSLAAFSPQRFERSPDAEKAAGQAQA